MLRSNLSCIGQDRETKLIKEGREAIWLVKQIVKRALEEHNKVESEPQVLQPIKFFILSNNLIDMTGIDLMVSVKKYYEELAKTNYNLKEPLFYF